MPNTYRSSWKTKSLCSIVEIEDGISCIGKSIVDLKLPNSIVIALIERENKFFLSEGSSRILKGDKLYIMADDDSALENFYICIGKNKGN